MRCEWEDSTGQCPNNVVTRVKLRKGSKKGYKTKTKHKNRTKWVCIEHFRILKAFDQLSKIDKIANF